MIVIDIQNIGFASTATNAKLSSNGKFTGGAFGVLQSMRKIRAEYAGKMVACWDGRSWRYQNYEAYKGNRDANPELVAIKDRWKSQIPYVRRMLTALGITQMISGNMEADDLAARIVGSRTGKPTTLISGDKDWLQLINPDTIWVDTIRDRVVHSNTFTYFTSYETQWQFIQAKALTGDAGDNIPGVGGVGPVGVKWIFSNYGSVDYLLNASINAESRKWPKKIRDFTDSEEGVAAYRRNLELVWLNHPNVPRPSDLKVTHGAANADALLALAEELNFASVIKDPEFILRPFINEFKHT